MKKLISILLIVVVVLSGCSGGATGNVATTEQTTATTESAEARAARLAAEKKQAEEAERKAEEEAKRKAEEEAKHKAEEEAKRRAELRARTVYAKKPIALYADAALTTPLELDVEVVKRTPLVTTEQVKDEAGALTAYQFESVGDLNQVGYVNAEDVVQALSDFIRRPVENVDYGYFERREIAQKPPVKVRGLYVTQYTASSLERMDALIEIANQTDINALVIDVKDDKGNLLFYSKAAESVMPELNENVAIEDIAAFVKKLKENDIYLIARVVTFKSPQYAAKYGDRAITKPDGSLYKKGDDIAWATAYDRILWDYVLGICEEAADVGFDEIQFDYVRFPVVSKSEDAVLDYHNTLDESKAEVIHKFLRYAYGQLAEKKVYITADIFGWVGSAVGDEGIGQHWEAMANAVDYVAPMMYPSHYGKDNYGIKYPDTNPAATIDASIKDILARNANLQTQPITRPWIQDFTASWLGKGRYIKYGEREVRAQIDALKANGVDEYMVWNSSNRYHADAFKNEGGE